MVMALQSKNNMGFLNGSIPEPITRDPLSVIWERNNTFIRSWIVQSLFNEIVQSVLFVKKALDLWAKLSRVRVGKENHKPNQTFC